MTNELYSEQGNNFEPQKVIQERLRDSSYLPTHSEIAHVIKPFDFDNWHQLFIDRDDFHELLNREYITILSDYLAQRVGELESTTNQHPMTILEVGAGNGRLNHFVNQALLQRIGDKVHMVATDNGSLQLKPAFPVEKMDFTQALRQYTPTIIICSWMPYGEDWTSAFRQEKSVQEYILIGEADGGNCGTNATWGIKEGSSDDKNQHFEYQQEGFERVDLKEISKQQICFTDTPGRYTHSSTVSFRRQS